ncbi:MAG TPA: metal-dependent transcriptional regulator [Candidatus Lumbricidophila sp.]|nr:metal-dependent transcriptional regulator [Candidatus Lumbricidophila sp.]
MREATRTAFEDYLKAIYSHTEWQPNPVTPSVLAAKVGVGPSSVTEMVKKLAAAGLVTHTPYGSVQLTETGTAEALSVLRRHRLIETWLVSELGYGWDEVHDEAEILEHAVSERLLNAIDARLGHPARDPHGDAIPTADGSVDRTPFVLLRDAAPGTVSTVLRISDRSPDLLRQLDALQVGPGTAISLVSVSPDAVSIAVDGNEVELPGEALDAIWVVA